MILFRMKTFARVKFHEGFMKALMDKEFPNLRMYCEEWLSKIDESDGTILCEVVDTIDIKTGKPKKSLDIDLTLFDYFFNVTCEEEKQERDRLWKLVDNNITRQVIKIVTI